MSKWKKEYLEDVVEILDHLRVPIKQEERITGIYPYYGANGIQGYISDYIFDDELVLLAEDGGHFGSKEKPIAYRVNGKCWVNNHAHVLKPKKNIDVDYLCYSLMFYDVSKIVNGSTRIKLTQGAMRKMKILLPPLETQKEIAKTLDKSSELVALRKKQLEELDNLIESVFYDMFGDPVRNEKSWEIKKIDELVKKRKNSIKRGPFGGALKKEIFVEEGYLVYEQYHALNDDYSFARYYIDENTFNNLKDFEVNPSDIIISCSGVNLGRLSIIPPGAKKGIINQALLKLTLDPLKIQNSLFVRIFTNTAFKQQNFGDGRGCAIPNFPPMSDFRKFNFIVPPLTLQNKFATIVEKIEEQRSEVKKALLESEDLFQKLMQDLLNPD